MSEGMKMRRDPVSARTKQTKRRLLAMAVALGMVVTYEAAILFGGEPKVSRPSVTEIPKVPAARSIGIRLATASNPQRIGSDQPMPTTLPLQGPAIPSMPAPPDLDFPPHASAPGSSIPIASSASLNIVSSSSPRFSDSEPIDQTGTDDDLGVAGAPSTVPIPPPMMPNVRRPAGKVTVKLAGPSDLPNALLASEGSTSTNSPLTSMGDAQLPSMVVASGGYVVTPMEEPSVNPMPSPQLLKENKPNGVRVSLSSNGPTGMINEGPRPQVVTQRTPELVTPKRNGVAVVHSVKSIDPDEIEPVPSKHAGQRSLLAENRGKGGTGSVHVVEPALTKRPGTKSTLASSRTVIEVTDQVDASDESAIPNSAPVGPAPMPLPPAMSIPMLAPANGGPTSLSTQLPPVASVSMAPPTLARVVPMQVPTPAESQRPPMETAHSAQTPHAAQPSDTIDVECLSAVEVPLPGSVTKVEVDGEDICHTMTRDRSISIIGSKIGKAKVLIWTEANRLKPHVLQVNIVKPFAKAFAKSSDMDQVKVILSSQFPNAKINVIADRDGTITLKGTVTDEISAKRIVELVRKLYLVPVLDKIEVSR